MIRFRVSGYTLKSCSILFWGTEEITFMATSANNDVFELKISAFKFYQDLKHSKDEDFHIVELL